MKGVEKIRAEPKLPIAVEKGSQIAECAIRRFPDGKKNAGKRGKEMEERVQILEANPLKRGVF